MGTWLSNVVVRGDVAAVVGVVLAEHSMRGFAVQRDGWTVLVLDRALEADGVQVVTGEISRRLGATAIGFRIEDSAVLWWWVFDAGVLLAACSAMPDFGRSCRFRGSVIARTPLCA